MHERKGKDVDLHGDGRDGDNNTNNEQEVKSSAKRSASSIIMLETSWSHTGRSWQEAWGHGKRAVPDRL